MRVRGAEVIAFLRDWPVGGQFFSEDGYAEETKDGRIVGIDPEEEVDVFDAVGVMVWHGEGPCPGSIEINGVMIPIDVEDGWTGPDSEEVFRAWRGDRRVYSVLLEPVDRPKLDAICAEHGWEVVQ